MDINEPIRCDALPSCLKRKLKGKIYSCKKNAKREVYVFADLSLEEQHDKINTKEKEIG